MARQKGFTLSELMVGMGVLSLLVMTASLLSAWAAYRYYTIRDRLLTETIAYQAETVFRGIFGQALDIGFNNVAVNNLPQSLPGQTGQIYHNLSIGTNPTRRGFKFDRIGASVDDWTRIATFYREDSTGIAAPGMGKGQALATMVFYRRPTVTTSGVIFFDLSSRNNSTALVRPDYGDVFIDRISRFEITKTKHQIANKTTSIEVNLSFRYHVFAGGKSSWCPMKDIEANTAGCNNGSVSRDLERRFIVTLTNGLIKSGSTYSGFINQGEERVMGDLYFFKTLSPARW